MEIILNVKEQSITTKTKCLVSDTENVYIARYEFDDAWDGYTKFGVFKQGQVIKQVLLVNDTCLIPNETLTKDGFMSIGVYGVNDDKRYPTVWTYPITVLLGAYGGTEPLPPTPSEWEQIISELSNINNDIEDINDDIDRIEETIVYEVAQATEKIRLLNQNKVDKITGMGLSQNSFTDEEKEKLDGLIPEELGKVDDVLQNGVSVLGIDKKARIVVPTAVSDLPNDSEYQTQSQVNTLVEGKGYQTSSDVESIVESYDYATNTRADEIEDEIPAIVDNVTSTSTTSGLSANQGKLLNDRINNISSRGRFLSLWNCVTGLPLTNPSGYPYEYHTGDYFVVSNTGTTNYIPNGSSYEGVASTTVYSGSIKVNDTIYYDGTSWSVFDTPGGGSGTLQDVYQNGSSVVSGDIAYVTTPTSLADLTSDSTHRIVTDNEKSTWNNKQASLVSGTNIKTINNNSILGSGDLSIKEWSITYDSNNKRLVIS